MIKKELYETLDEEVFTLSIGNITGRLVLELEGSVSFEKEEVSDLIQVLKDFYERMD